ncbi:MAG: hypothetical protein DGJ47_000639 [Rickettsiaceae bacterium]
MEIDSPEQDNKKGLSQQNVEFFRDTFEKQLSLLKHKAVKKAEKYQNDVLGPDPLWDDDSKEKRKKEHGEEMYNFLGKNPANYSLRMLYNYGEFNPIEYLQIHRQVKN